MSWARLLLWEVGAREVTCKRLTARARHTAPTLTGRQLTSGGYSANAREHSSELRKKPKTTLSPTSFSEPSESVGPSSGPPHSSRASRTPTWTFCERRVSPGRDSGFPVRVPSWGRPAMWGWEWRPRGLGSSVPRWTDRLTWRERAWPAGRPGGQAQRGPPSHGGAARGVSEGTRDPSARPRGPPYLPHLTSPRDRPTDREAT